MLACRLCHPHPANSQIPHQSKKLKQDLIKQRTPLPLCDIQHLVSGVLFPLRPSIVTAAASSPQTHTSASSHITQNETKRIFQPAGFCSKRRRSLTSVWTVTKRWNVFYMRTQSDRNPPHAPLCASSVFDPHVTWKHNRTWPRVSSSEARLCLTLRSLSTWLLVSWCQRVMLPFAPNNSQQDFSLDKGLEAFKKKKNVFTLLSFYCGSFSITLTQRKNLLVCTGKTGHLEIL